MIVISNTRYVPVNPGYIVLQDENGAYYYVHKTLYDQAVILNDRYMNNVQVLQEQIGGNSDHNCITTFVENAPRPINILGYFLALMERDIEYWGDVVGALDVISSAINLRNFIKQPKEIRQSVQFSLTLREEYSDGWELFLNTQCYSYDEMKQALNDYRNPKPVEVVSQPSRNSSMFAFGASDEDDEDDGEIDIEALLASGADLLEQAEAEAQAEFDKQKQDEEKKSEHQSKPSIPASEGGDGLSVIKNRRRML